MNGGHARRLGSICRTTEVLRNLCKNLTGQHSATRFEMSQNGQRGSVDSADATKLDRQWRRIQSQRLATCVLKPAHVVGGQVSSDDDARAADAARRSNAGHVLRCSKPDTDPPLGRITCFSAGLRERPRSKHNHSRY
jgi:hypothetical protein